MYLSSKSEGNKFLFSTISQFLFSSQIEASSRDRVKLEHDRADSDRLQMNGRSLPIHWGRGETSAFGFHARFDQSILKSWEFQVGRFHRYARFMLMRCRLY